MCSIFLKLTYIDIAYIFFFFLYLSCCNILINNKESMVKNSEESISVRCNQIQPECRKIFIRIIMTYKVIFIPSNKGPGDIKDKE